MSQCNYFYMLLCNYLKERNIILFLVILLHLQTVKEKDTEA